MHFYNFFLKSYALKFLFYHKIKKKSEDIPLDVSLNDITITISDSGVINQVANNKKKSLLDKQLVINIIGILYFAFVLLIIGWQVVYSIVKSIVELNGRYVTASAFSFLYLGQLITGALFYNGKFFNKTFYK